MKIILTFHPTSKLIIEHTFYIFFVTILNVSILVKIKENMYIAQSPYIKLIHRSIPYKWSVKNCLCGPHKDHKNRAKCKTNCPKLLTAFCLGQACPTASYHVAMLRGPRNQLAAHLLLAQNLGMLL